ncbi:MAG: helix-hairpin-helix domain-containing protein [Bacteroidota bacterium]|nr:helix-hairpin-helix domain-containing protein [Bacteroidota bacterium]
MTFRKFLKQWLGYTRRERTGSMVLIVILLVVLVVRTVGTDEGRRGSGEGRGSRLRRATADAAGDPHQQVKGDSMQQLGRGSPTFAPDDRGFGGQRETHTSKGSHTNRANKGSSQGKTSPLDPSLRPADFAQDDIDINRADSAELEALPGIGPVLSVRIIKYRYLLGYYYEIDQLNDVYGLDTAVIEMNRHRFTCDSTLVRKININTADYRDLLRHPYINRSQVESIITYRRLSGSFNDISELRLNRIFTPGELIRLRPYLELK